ncbi:MAG: alpha/beta hydrolase [Candidatus Omnitrophota bacterium]|jgi:pimeloyl-ACP methyl ester carboxylesterase|nr:MAG: alpha/beta hydrolase [Candidatus Omnitrophota bacterium]
MRSENLTTKYISLPHEDGTLRMRYFEWNEGFPLLYLHGWGCSGAIFLPLMNQLSNVGKQITLDFPGFGESERPQATWGTENYADCIVNFLHQHKLAPCLVIGHSFGGRVAIQMAVRHPNTLAGMTLIASAGLKQPVPLFKKLRIQSIRNTAKVAKRLLPGKIGERIKESLYQKIASRDWLQAGEMRDIFVRVVNEDLSGLLPSVEIPVMLIWGEGDQETPPESGRRMNELLTNSTYIELPGFDHYSILDRGRHQVGFHIRRFIQEKLPHISLNTRNSAS